ncbi:MAG TPA: AAA family ATPase [Mycobacteriales bacterium]|nr:AAA family ATPase [Mycobacteriales bacterium]
MTEPGPGSGGPGVQLRADPAELGLDSRRGLVRIAPSVLAALGGRPYSVVKLTGPRSTGALVALSSADQDPGTILVDDLILDNLGVTPGAPITVELVASLAADRIVLTGPPQVTAVLPSKTVRLALLGKVVCQGDTVSLLQQDVALPEGSSVELMSQGRAQLQSLFGQAWQGMVLTAVEAPTIPTVVTMTTDVQWAPSSDGAALPATESTAQPVATVIAPSPPKAGSPAAEDLPGAADEARQLRELLDVGLNNPGLLTKLGTTPSLGVLLSGPAGCGKTTMVRQVASSLGLTVRSVWCPQVAAFAPDKAASEIATLKAAALAKDGAREVLLLDGIEELAPAQGDAPLAAVIVAAVREIVAAGRAVVALSATPDAVSRDLVRAGDALAAGLDPASG